MLTEILTLVWSSFQQNRRSSSSSRTSILTISPESWHFDEADDESVNLTLFPLHLNPDIFTSILTFWPCPSSWASWRQEWWRWQGFRIFSPRHWYGQVLLENGPRLVNFIPQSLYSTAAYRGSPPCTVSWHPYTRETAMYVLGDDQQIRVGGNNQIRETSGDWSRRIKYGKVIG